MRVIILDRKDDSHNCFIIYWYKSFDNKIKTVYSSFKSAS